MAWIPAKPQSGQDCGAERNPGAAVTFDRAFGVDPQVVDAVRFGVLHQSPDTGGGAPLGELVPPGDVPALARAIARLLDDPAAAEARAGLAHASALGRFSAAGTMTVLSSVWDEVLGPWSPPVPPRITWPPEAAYRPPAEVAASRLF